jgi:anaerobic ribonucleoside-triphosphate reductase
MTKEKLSPFQKMARHLRKEALALEIFDKLKEAKEKRSEAKLMDNLQKIDEEYHRNKKQ